MTTKQKLVLTKVETFFIDEHVRFTTIDQMAENIGASVELIKEYVDSLPDSAKTPTPAPKKLGQFETRKGVVAMTSDQSMTDDAAAGTKQNDAFLKEHENNIHKIRPDEPVS